MKAFNKPLIYVAGPYRGEEIQNTRRAVECGHAIRRHSGVPVVPHLNALMDFYHECSAEVWLDLDFHMLLRCDAVFRLPGFSKGADKETMLATRKGITVFRNDWDLLKIFIDDFLKYGGS